MHVYHFRKSASFRMTTILLKGTFNFAPICVRICRELRGKMSNSSVNLDKRQIIILTRFSIDSLSLREKINYLGFSPNSATELSLLGDFKSAKMFAISLFVAKI